MPQDLLACPEIRFFEICNGGSSYAPASGAESYTVEKFWDAVNAFRRLRGQPLLYGVGSDDAHFYDVARINGENGVGDAWIMVRAAALTPESLLSAMHRGDFYATTGVLLDEVQFTPADKTLRVQVHAEPGVKYRIHFVVTKRNFAQTVGKVNSPAKDQRPARTVPVYADDVGRIAQTTAGSVAAYQLEDDDLYVRAQIESDRPAKYIRHFHPQVQTAWTQPYVAAAQ